MLRANDAALPEVTRAFEVLAGEARERLAAGGLKNLSEAELSLFLGMRIRGQTYELLVPIAAVPAPVMATAPAAPAASRDLTAEEESLTLILKAAQKTAEVTIIDARARAEEIIAEARYRASEITRESDRKAFEAASRIQTEIVKLEDELTHSRDELDTLHCAVEDERARIRGFAQDLLRSVGEELAVTTLPANVIQLEPAPVLDLTTENNRAAARD